MRYLVNYSVRKPGADGKCVSLVSQVDADSVQGALEAFRNFHGLDTWEYYSPCQVWRYEDELGPLDESTMTRLFRESKVIDGVRMYPARLVQAIERGELKTPQQGDRDFHEIEREWYALR